jgi:hypothetical protein
MQIGDHHLSLFAGQGVHKNLTNSDASFKELLYLSFQYTAYFSFR